MDTKAVRNRQKFISVKTGGNVYRIELKDIMYGEKRDRKILVTAKESTYLFPGTMKGVSSFLDERFLQCHKSYFFNMDYITKMEDRTVYLKNGYRVTLGREAFRRGKNRFLNYLVEKNAGK